MYIGSINTIITVEINYSRLFMFIRIFFVINMLNSHIKILNDDDTIIYSLYSLKNSGLVKKQNKKLIHS